MPSFEKTYRDDFILPDNRSIGATNITAMSQGEFTLPMSAHHNEI